MRFRLYIARGDKTQEQFARELGTSQAYYSDLERGTREPSVETLRLLVNKLGTGILEDFGFEIRRRRGRRSKVAAAYSQNIARTKTMVTQ